LENKRNPKDSENGAETSSRLIAFFSSKGGSGSTLLATNISHQLILQKENLLLMDVDFQLGDVLTALNLTPKNTLSNVHMSLQRGTSANLSNLPRHKSGLPVLSQGGDFESIGALTAPNIGNVLSYLKTQYDRIVVDGIRDFSEHALAIVDAADRIVIVTEQEVLAIRRAKIIWNILIKIGFNQRNIFFIVNKFEAKKSISIDSLQKMFTPSILFMAQADAQLTNISLNRGTPLYELQPKNELTRQTYEIAQQLITQVPRSNLTKEAKAARAPQKKTWWQSMFGANS
jgi:pilus assembly protein CpaE